MAEPNERQAKAAFAVMALLCIFLALGLASFGARLGIAADTARLVATVLLVLGTADLLILFFWRRIFARRP
jgi:hypothetical protein